VTVILEWLSVFFLLAGSLLSLSGGIGLLRLPDFFSRVHAVGMIDSLATPLLLCGLMLQMDWSLDLLKVLLIVAFVVATNPTSSNAMAKAALHDGYRPAVTEKVPADKENPPSPN
jgi:multicomponent Na+:H+ antiporter subunit G